MSPALALAGWWGLRLAALLALQPAWLRALGPLWLAIAALLALAIALPLALSTPHVFLDMSEVISASAWLRGALVELALGGLAGLLVGLPGLALLGAARASGRALGLRQANALEALILALVLALGLGLGLHRPLLLGLREFALLLPPGGGGPGALLAALPRATPAIVGAADHLLFLALALATPVILTRALVELAGALMLPAEGERPSAGVLPWLASAAAMIALCASWSAYPEAWLRALAPPPALALP
ncbi:MAG: hypothetical protein H6710_23890 [Myxococcales bacterium]|nr:hypothetical protein [Myxococcales bacterium]MCB9707004.1 hypothetical protein [Myxococcales bacterium]